MEYKLRHLKSIASSGIPANTTKILYTQCTPIYKLCALGAMGEMHKQTYALYTLCAFATYGTHNDQIIDMPLSGLVYTCIVVHRMDV